MYLFSYSLTVVSFGLKEYTYTWWSAACCNIINNLHRWDFFPPLSFFLSTVENGQLPDPAHWAVADVVNYFKATGFEEQANAFQDQVSKIVLLILFLHFYTVYMYRIFG